MANSTVHLNEYATVPTYNIKAVVRATGISPSTLRAWERRYNMAQPQRSESGYRLYSERDVAIIRWLKAQVDAGMAISHAVAWFEERGGEAALELPAVLASPTAKRVRNDAAQLPESADSQPDGEVGYTIRSFAALGSALIEALVDYAETAADAVLTEAFALYPVEVVGEEIIAPVLKEIGERWHAGRLSVVTEHFASNYLLQRLGSVLRATHNQQAGAALWVGCAPGELHEAGALLLALYLRRQGYAVRFLGQNVPVEDLVAEIQVAETQNAQPAMILVSASTEEGARGVRNVAQALAAMPAHSPKLGFGGSYFVRNPGARAGIAATWLGDTAQDGLNTIHARLNGGTGEPTNA